MITKFTSAILDFIFPRCCISCNSKLELKQIFICDDCDSKIKLIDQNLLVDEYKRKFSRDNYINDYSALYDFETEGSLQNMLHSLKYEKKFKVGILLGKSVGKILNVTIKTWHADFLIPIPLYHLKKAERGYNQAYYVCKGISEETGLKINSRVVKRVKNTTSQTTLTLEERKNNINNAFKIRSAKDIKNRRIILVDDVITTGATISECAKILKANGAAKVFALSVATPLNLTSSPVQKHLK